MTLWKENLYIQLKLNLLLKLKEKKEKYHLVSLFLGMHSERRFSLVSQMVLLEFSLLIKFLIDFVREIFFFFAILSNSKIILDCLTLFY